MPQLPFQPDPGLFTDTTTFAGKGGWIDCSNVRFYNGRWEVIGGQVQRGTLSMTTSPNQILEWKATSGTSYIAWGSSARLMIETGGALYDVTPATAGTWSFANYGETLIANVSGGKVWQWSLNTAAIAVQVTNAPVAVTCVLVTPSRQLIAFGCNEEVSGTFNGRCIRCSDLEDITDWTTTAANNVEENILDGAKSAIVTAKMVGEYVAVWTSNDLWMGTFIGDPSQTWRYERVGSLCGAIGLNAVCVDGSVAYWLTPDLVFMAWSPGSPPTEIACPIIEDLRSYFPTDSTASQTFACHISKFDEVWFTYPNTVIVGEPYRGRYVAFTLKTGHWFKGEMQRRAMHQGLSAVLAASSYASVSFPSKLLTCESGKRGAGIVQQSQGGTYSASGLAWRIYSSAIYLDSGHRRMMLRSYLHDFLAQTGNITVGIRAGDYPVNMGPGTGAYSKDLTLGIADKKKDFRQSGRLVSVNFSGDDGSFTTDTFARQGMPVFDIVPMGER